MWGKSIKTWISWKIYIMASLCKEKMVKIMGTGKITGAFFPRAIIILRSLLFDLPSYFWKCVSYSYLEFNWDKEHDTLLKLHAGNKFSITFFFFNNDDPILRDLNQYNAHWEIICQEHGAY